MMHFKLKCLIACCLSCFIQIGVVYKVYRHVPTPYRQAYVNTGQRHPSMFIDPQPSIEEIIEEEDERLKLSPYIESSSDPILTRQKPSKKNKVLTIFKYPPHRMGFSHCPIYTQCTIVKKFSDMPKADFVVVDMYLIWNDNFRSRKNDKNFLASIPKYTRPKNQRWAVFTLDPPFWMEALARVYPELTSSFNLTISYRLDADITFHFGKLRKWPPPVDKDYGAMFDKKTGSVVWMVSHCITDSRREEYVDRMNSIVHIDVLGECGNVTRPGCGDKSEWMNPKACVPDLGKEFKFYLAFENHFCPDYITEKYFKVFDGKTDLIPVVRGGFDYKRYLPKGTYIDAADFKSPEDLAHYLVELGNDKERYINMWRTKDRWRLIPSGSIFCSLCELAHKHSNHEGYHQNYIHSLYGGVQDTCKSPTDVGYDIIPDK